MIGGVTVWALVSGDVEVNRTPVVDRYFEIVSLEEAWAKFGVPHRLRVETVRPPDDVIPEYVINLEALNVSTPELAKDVAKYLEVVIGYDVVPSSELDSAFGPRGTLAPGSGSKKRDAGA